MKQLRVTFTDEEHNQLSTIKGKTSWHDFILRKEPVNNFEQLTSMLHHLVKWLGHAKVTGVPDEQLKPVLEFAEYLGKYLKANTDV